MGAGASGGADIEGRAFDAGPVGVGLTESSPRGAYVSGYDTTGIQTAKNVPTGIGQQILGQTPNELAVSYGLLNPGQKYEALEFEPYEFNLGPVSFSTENLVGPAFDTYNTVVAPAVQNLLDTSLAETAATSILGVPSTIGGAIVSGLQNLEEKDKTVQEIASSFVNPHTSSGVSIGGLNNLFGHPDFDLDATPVDSFETKEFTIPGSSYFNAIPEVLDAYDKVEDFLFNKNEINSIFDGVDVQALDNSIFGLSNAFASTDDNFGNYSGISPSFDTDALSRAGGDPRLAEAQRLAAELLAQQAAASVIGDIDFTPDEVKIINTPPADTTPGTTPPGTTTPPPGTTTPGTKPPRTTPPRTTPPPVTTPPDDNVADDPPGRGNRPNPTVKKRKVIRKKIATATKAKLNPKGLSRLPKFAQEALKRGIRPDLGSDYVQDQISNFLNPPKPIDYSNPENRGR